MFEQTVKSLIELFAIPSLCLSLKLKRHYFFDGDHGRTLPGNTIIIMNHYNAKDARTLYYAFRNNRLHFFASEYVFSHGRFFTWLIQLFGAIKVDRKRLDISYFKKAEQALAGGGILCIFPEGRTNRKRGPLFPFKAGFVQLAHKTGARILPIFSTAKSGFKGRTRLMIDKFWTTEELFDPALSLRQNYENVSFFMRDRIEALGLELQRRLKSKNRRNMNLPENENPSR
jgi:1-acyl-sn-glycerol-3-phosphate acyltransferase